MKDSREEAEAISELSSQDLSKFIGHFIEYAY
jgi:hypothetical protein